MASVTSLDQDMKKLRLGRYTPQAANEARSWLEGVLGERLPAGDLLDALKDGTVLCKLVNLAVPNPGIRFKKSPMPFIQMENISHFLRACENAPLNMPSHDRFLTVDLYESKDPAQVLQCLSAFSRVANSVNPSNFPTTIGPKRGGGPLSPSTTGASGLQGAASLSSPGFPRGRGTSVTSGSSIFNPLARSQPERALSPQMSGGSNASRNSNGIPKSPPGGVSSWSRKTDEGITAPAWNIHQYGYMGGASQGNQGIAFGARRQITSAGPQVPSLAEKERKRREKEAEDERLRILAEEAEHKRRVERQAEEERQWEEETRRQREEEQRRLDKQKQEWEEQERQWKLEEEMRLREEQEQQEKADNETRRKRAGSDARLRGQYLSQYQAEQASKPRSRRNSQYEPEANAEQERIRELERQLEEAKERERQYQAEREERSERRRERARSKSRTRNRSQSRPRPQPPPRAPSPQDSTASWAQADDRDYLRKQWQETQRQPPRPLPEPTAPALPTRPLPEPSARPLPDPAAYAKQSRTDRYLASNPPPVAPKPTNHIPPELTSTSERAAEDARRAESQAKTKAGGWASKSLLEREMERERERQKEWEEAQRSLQNTAKDPTAGTGEGQSWDVNQYGYMGGDSQNKGGISFGGRRQILGPRPFGSPSAKTAPRLSHSQLTRAQGDYCDVYLTHDSMSVRKAHNAGRNHLRNVQAYYEQISSEQTQLVINSITDAYNAEGQANPMTANPMGGFGPLGGGFPPHGFPPPGMPGMPPPFMGRGGPGPNMPPMPFPPPNMPMGGPPGPMPPNMPPFPPPNMGGAPPNMPFPFPPPGHAGSPPGGMPFPPPGAMPPGRFPPFPPPHAGPPGGPPGR